MSDEREGAVRLPRVHEPGLYRIRIAGRVDPSLADRIGGMVAVGGHTESDEPFTELTGEVADQAALQGRIDQLYARGHVLLEVKLLTDGGRGVTTGTSRNRTER